MQLTESSLRKIIKEELKKVLFEADGNDTIEARPLEKDPFYGLPREAFKHIVRAQKDNYHDQTIDPTSKEGIIQAIISGLSATPGVKYDYNSWHDFLNRKNDNVLSDLMEKISEPQKFASVERGYLGKQQTDNWLEKGTFSERMRRGIKK